MCPTEKLGRQLILHRGLHPIVIDDERSTSVDLGEAVRKARAMGFCGPRDTVIAAYFDHGAADGHELSMRVITVSLERASYCSILLTLVFIWAGRRSSMGAHVSL